MNDSAEILRILVPFDYSQVGRLALEVAVKFEGQIPVEIFMRTVEEGVGTFSTTPEYRSLHARCGRH